jgi:hypothetical protein
MLRLASWNKSPVELKTPKKTARSLSEPSLLDCRYGHIAALAFPPYPARQVGMSNAQLRMQFQSTTSYLFDASIFYFATQRVYQITLPPLSTIIAMH